MFYKGVWILMVLMLYMLLLLWLDENLLSVLIGSVLGVMVVMMLVVVF